jgi:hypothetical protein
MTKDEIKHLHEKIEQERILSKEARLQLDLRSTEHQEKLVEKDRDISKLKEDIIKERAHAEVINSFLVNIYI